MTTRLTNVLIAKMNAADHQSNALTADRQQEIQEDVGILVSTGILREVQYPTWLANLVMVKKHNGDWRMCVDYTDLNKHCPKDCYPLPKIDQMVEAITGYQAMAFLDAYKGYTKS